MHQNYANGSNLLDLRVWQGGLQVGKSSGSLEQRKIRLQYNSPNWVRMQKRLIHSNFPRNITGFLLEDELYASTDISKHLEEFLKKYLNGLQCKSAHWTRLEKLVQSSKSPMAKRYFCIKVMWKHHMTSPNFGGNFKGIYQIHNYSTSMTLISPSSYLKTIITYQTSHSIQCTLYESFYYTHLGCLSYQD